MAASPRSVATVVDSLDAHLGELAAEVVRAIDQQIPSYLAAGGPGADDVASVVHSNLRAWISASRHDRRPTAAELHTFEEAARRRARIGHPLPDLLHAYRIGASVAWQALAALARDGDGDLLDAALEVTGSILRYIDDVSTAITEAYVDERDRLELDGAGRARAIVDELAAGTTPPGCAERHIFVVVVAGEEPLPSRRLVARLAKRLAGEPPAPVVALGRDLLVALPHPGVEAPRLHLEAEQQWGPLLMAVAPPTTASGAAAALAELSQLATAVRARGRTGLIRLEDEILMAIACGWGGRVAEVLREIAAPLHDHDRRSRASLVEAVRALAELGSRAAVAERLHLHRNAVRWRLGCVAELTGLDPARSRDLLVLAAAIEA